MDIEKRGYMLKRNYIALGINIFVMLLVTLAVFSTFVMGEDVPVGDDSGGEEAIEVVDGESVSSDESKVVIPLEEIVDDSEEESGDVEEGDEEIEDEGTEEFEVSEVVGDGVLAEEVGEVYVPIEEVVPEAEDGLESDDSVVIDPTKVQDITLESDDDSRDESSEEVVLEETSGGSGSGSGIDEAKYDFVDIDELVPEEEITEEESEREIKYIFERGGVKEFETMMDEGNFIDIEKDEAVAIEEGEWKKKVSLNSKEHHEKEVVVYSDIVPSRKHEIYLYWEQEEKFIDFEGYDEDSDGLIERISWVVPHLSLQEFEIIIDLGETEDVNATEIIITGIHPPDSFSDNSSDIYFNFSVSYHNLSIVNCSFDLESDSVSIIQSEISGAQSYNSGNLALANGDYSWNFECLDVMNESVKDSVSGDFSINVAYSVNVNFSVSDQSISEGESVTFHVDVLSEIERNISYLVHTEDGASFGGLSNYELTDQIDESFSHVYSSDGSYKPTLTVLVDGTPHDRQLSVSVSDVTEEDNEKPSVTLIDPDDNEIISREEISFIYKADDNIKVDNCTFSLYYYNNSVLGSLVYDEVKDNIVHGERVEIKLHNFDDGDYSWDVDCYDNSTNHEDSERDFEYDSDYDEDSGVSSSSSTSSQSSSKKTLGSELSESDSEEVNRINDLIDSINDFFIAEERFSAEEREAVEDMGLIDELKFYKKRLLQMELDLGHNLDYVIGEEKRAERRREINEEVDAMSGNIPESLQVLQSSEYFKNSLELDMEGIVRAYAETKGLVLSEKGIREMARQNELLQNQITVSVRAKHVNIDYLDGSRDFTLITKEIVVKDGNFDSYIEVIPAEVAGSSSKVEFAQEARELGDSLMFEMAKENVDGMVVYQIDDLVDLAKIEGTSTVSFKEDVPLDQIGGVTGLVTFVGGGSGGVMFYVSWMVAIIVVLFVSTFSFRTVKVRKLKKNHDIKTLFEISAEIEGYLKQKDVDSARERYLEAQALYQSIPENGKKIAYIKLEKLFQQIDKKDMGALIKEFLSVAKEGRTDEALMIYGNIQAIYPRMPSRLQQKVYDKVNPIVRKIQRSRSA